MTAQNFNATGPDYNLTDPAPKWVLPSEEYYSNGFLQISSGIDEMGAPLWYIVLCLLAAWTVAFLALIKGVRSIGKVGSSAAREIFLSRFFRSKIFIHAGSRCT